MGEEGRREPAPAEWIRLERSPVPGAEAGHPTSSSGSGTERGDLALQPV